MELYAQKLRDIAVSIKALASEVSTVLNEIADEVEGLEETPAKTPKEKMKYFFGSSTNLVYRQKPGGVLQYWDRDYQDWVRSISVRPLSTWTSVTKAAAKERMGK